MSADPNAFFVSGGTMKPTAPAYVERAADAEFYEGLRTGEFCFVLTSRQMGKSSLMARTSARLRAEGFLTAIVDLTLITETHQKDAPPPSAEVWYRGISRRIAQELGFSSEFDAWWKARAGLAEVQRLSEFLEDFVLTRTDDRKVVIFVDEIDTTLRLPFTDDFFAAIRAFCNIRATHPRFDRLTFALLGVASPSDLIKDGTRTPFNIGKRVELNDFTREEAGKLTAGFNRDDATNRLILDRILHWTDGQPYLTQRLCLEAALRCDERADQTLNWENEVDLLVEEHFTSPAASRAEVHLKYIRDRLLGEPESSAVLLEYLRIVDGQPVWDRPQSLVHTTLKLAGVVKVGDEGMLRMRNRIYERAFDRAWVRKVMPTNPAPEAQTPEPPAAPAAVPLRPGPEDEARALDVESLRAEAAPRAEPDESLEAALRTMSPGGDGYVERAADAEFYEGLKAGEFCFVLTPRQMGKTSLMQRTAARLRADGCLTAVVDLSRIGALNQEVVPPPAEAWYRCLFRRMGEALGIERVEFPENAPLPSAEVWYREVCAQIARGLGIAGEFDAWWTAHAEIAEVQRFSEFLDDLVLTRTDGRQMVIFFDEIDTTLPLPFTDDFFAAIRACFNARATHPQFERLTFALLGVASPFDLIKDVARTPFNIGRRIELNDFTTEEALKLAPGFERDDATNQRILGRILHWTDGQPYLTRRLCREVALRSDELGDGGTINWEREVDSLAETHFGSATRRTEAHFKFISDRLLKDPRLPAVLRAYLDIVSGEHVADAPQSPIHAALKLAGIVKADREGRLRTRNRTYEGVFDRAWIFRKMSKRSAPHQTMPPPSTPASPAMLDPSVPLPETPPVPLWQMLEQEFRAVHGESLQLDAEYTAARDAAIAKGIEELKAAIQKRVGAAQERLTEAELNAEVEREILRAPELINGPACRELFQRIHQFVEEYPERPARHSALCLSGGGIRSATFALGVLQGLAQRAVLPDFAYLSTVSGGGYIGSWLSSWIHRNEKDSAAVFWSLGTPEKPSEHPGIQATTADSSREPKQPFETEPPPIRHLRKYSNYLTPALGLLSGDGWAVAATVARNLMLNWLIIVPALLFVLLGSRFALRLALHDLGKNPVAGMAAAAIGFVCGVYALSNLLARRGKTQAAVLWHCVFPIVLFSAFATLAWFWARSAYPATGYFADPLQRMAFYAGWGGLSALLAAPIGAWIRRHQKLAVASDWFVRLVCLLTVFALTGLAACWFGNRAAEGLVRADQLQKAEKNAALAPAPAVQAKPATLAPDWALLSRQKEASSLTAWVPVEPGKISLQDYPDLSMQGPPARTATQLRLKAAILAVCFGFPLLLSLIFLANTVLTGLLSTRMLDEDREWFARVSGWAFLLALLFCGISLLVLRGPDWLMALWATWPKLLSSIAGGSALLTIGGGKSDKMSAKERADEKPDTKNWIFGAVVRFAAPIFVVTLIVLCSLLTTILLQKMIGHSADPRAHGRLLRECGLRHLGLAAACFAFVAAMSSRNVNINKFSLHAMYRNRLIRAYLGATNRFRAPNLFTGFDPADNLPIAELRAQRPFHVVNAALNLVGGSDLAWQQRMAMSFTMTPLTCGSGTLGYRDSAGYARGQDQRGMTLGTALAISGAAVSPNHGYNSSPLIAFILAFFNARLGGWFGNPGPAGGETWTKSSPTLALKPLIAEAFGLTDADHPYVYLSDGGHFENLGLYEMVLRRCRTIVISDAGCDPEYWFEDLGNAISKVRVDFGIRIVFLPHIDIRKFDPDASESETARSRHCAIGRICYSDVDGGTPELRDGTLIYIKPTMCGWEPMDVFHYHREHPVFPHEPTTDQWFTESQFESYRTLGYHSVEQICENQPVTGLSAFAKKAESYVVRES